MTKEEFIKVLEGEGYSYEIEGDKIIVTHKWNVDLRNLTSIPPGVEFMNVGWVDLDRLTSLPPDVEFNNGGNVDLDALTSIPPGVEFNNGRWVNLGSLIGGWVPDWKGNIEGVGSTRLLNKMIKDGVFER